MLIVWIALSSGFATVVIFVLTRVLRRNIDDAIDDPTREYWDDINLN